MQSLHVHLVELMQDHDYIHSYIYSFSDALERTTESLTKKKEAQEQKVYIFDCPSVCLSV